MLAVRAGLVAGGVDDPVLLASVGHRLVLVLGDPVLGNDTRRAIQVTPPSSAHAVQREHHPQNQHLFVHLLCPYQCIANARRRRSSCHVYSD